MTVYVLGAGPVGLAVVDGVIGSGANRFVVIERGPQIGGLAQTVSWQGVGAHDLGPHKIFTRDEMLMARVKALLPESEWLTRKKVSSIFINGVFLPYPPSPFSLAAVFGVPAFTRMVAGYAAARIKSLTGSKMPKTFEEDLTARLGSPLYEVLFKPIALKLWGDPSVLDVKLSRGRVQTPSLVEILTKFLNRNATSEFEARTFYYPRGGLGRIWTAIEAKARGRGEFYLAHAVTGFDVCENRICAIYAQGACGTRRFTVDDGDFVASTLPIAKVVELLGSVVPADLPAAIRDIIVLNDLLLVFLHINRPSLMKDSWVFVPDPDVSFHRLSEQESFDPGMTPNGSIVCCEVMSSDTRKMGAKSDPELIDAAVSDLGKMGYHDFDVLGSKVIRLPKSYPVFRVGYEAGLALITSALDRIENFRTVGRQGAFNYIGTLDAMDIGYGFVRWYSDRVNSSWTKERLRTSHYPVLD